MVKRLEIGTYGKTATDVFGVPEKEWMALCAKTGLNEQEILIKIAAYGYVLAQAEAGRIARFCGKIKPKGAVKKTPNPSSIFSGKCRALAMSAIGLRDEMKIIHWNDEADRCEKVMREVVITHPLWTEWAHAVKGLGPTCTALLLAAIGDYTRVDYVSGLWKSFFLHVENGHAAKLEKGKQGTKGYHLARVVLGRLRINFFKMWKRMQDMNIDPGFYGIIYNESLARYKNTRPLVSEGQNMGAAIRYFQKMLLAHAWEILRESKGLPAPAPYIVALSPDGKPHNKIEPEEAMEEQAIERRKIKPSVRPFIDYRAEEDGIMS